MYIYSYFDKDGTPLYVGSTWQVLQRFRIHQYEHDWMSKVISITVRGPYPDDLVYEFEKNYISKMQPIYNVNSLDYNESPDFIDTSDKKYFSSITEFVEFYKQQPDTILSSTYYLRKIDIEVIRHLAFYMDVEKSALVRDALEIGLTQLANECNHEDIYNETRKHIYGPLKFTG